MAKLIFEKSDGTRTILKKDLPDDYYTGRIICLDDYIAWKLWCNDDVKEQLINNGFKGTDDEVSAVLNCSSLSCLGDCTEDDWYIIDDAVCTAESNGYISRK